MNEIELREAQIKFEANIVQIEKSRKSLHEFREKFINYYSLEKIALMPMDSYVLGKPYSKIPFHFCYALERQLDGLGRIIGSTADKFGLYYGRTKSDSTIKYRFTKKYGSNKDIAFDNIKNEIIELIKYGKENNLTALAKNKISPMFKGKILSSYYPKHYLNVFSDKHLEYFLIQLNLDNPKLIKGNAIYKREALARYKENDEIMKSWSLDLFSHFLYSYYPGRPNDDKEKNKKNTILDDFRNPEFPSDYNAEWEDLEIIDPIIFSKKSKKRKSITNPDYEKEARKSKRLGDRGEKIAIEMEKKRLVDLGYPELAENVKPSEFDYLGYDIKSFEVDGSDRFIEVKASQSKVGAANFFLSINELTTAKKLCNYYIYMVYDIISKNPKIWVIANPFNPENDKVLLTAISYRVVINAQIKEKKCQDL